VSNLAQVSNLALALKSTAGRSSIRPMGFRFAIMVTDSVVALGQLRAPT
jgi:hypothetical protein